MKDTIIKLFKDLRKLIIIGCGYYFVCFLICYIQRENIYAIVLKPMKDVLPRHQFVYSNIWEMFFADLSLSGYCALVLSLPVILLCIYKYFSPSLYKRELKLARAMAISALVLFAVATLLLYYVILPNAMSFFIVDNKAIARPLLNINEYLSTFFHLIIAFGVVFQAPLVFVLLVAGKFISPDFLSSHRRISIVIIFIISAIITPPDVFSQIVVALMLKLISEMTNLVIKYGIKYKEKHQEKRKHKLKNKENK